MQEPTPIADDEVVLLDQKTLADYVRVLRYRKRTIIGTFLCVLLCGVLVAFLSKPTYSRTIRILVEGKGFPGDQDAHDPLKNLFTPAYVHEVDTQMEVLKSEVIQAAACDAAGVPRKQVLDPLHPIIQVDVKQIAATDVIEVTFSGPRASYIERLSEALPGVYAKYVTDNRKSEVISALDFASKELHTEQDQLQRAESLLEQFKSRNKVADLDIERNNRIVAAINAEARVRDAVQAEAAAQANLTALENTRKSLPQDIRTVTTATNSAAIALQTQRLNELVADRSRIAFFYKPNSPELAKLDQQIAEAKRQLSQTPPTETIDNRTTNTAISAYDAKIAEARGALAVAQTGLQQARVDQASLSGGLEKFTPLEREQAQLLRDVSEHTAKVATLATGVEELEMRSNANHTPVLPLSTPTPAEQTGPRSFRFLAIFVVLGLILGGALALLQSSLDDRIHTIRDFQKIARPPILAYLPTTKRRQDSVIGQTCNAALLEGYRMLRSNIKFAAQRSSLEMAVPLPIRTLMVTSTLAQEGKSSVALNLAASMVYDGRRVLLVDANIRKPELHHRLDRRPNPGFSDVLAGRTPLGTAIQDTPLPGLSFLSAGTPSTMTAELLDSAAMRGVMEGLLQHADLVIFDSPACLDSYDAPLLSSLVDGVVYVVQLGQVRQDALREGLDSLWRADARVLGAVINRIDLALNRDDVHFNYAQHAGQETQFQPDDSHALPAYTVPQPGKPVATSQHTVADVIVDKRKEGRTA